MTSNILNDQESRSSKDHDVLTRIDVNLTNFIIRFDKHEKEDCKRFDNIEKTLNWVMKCIYMVGGGVVLIEFVTRFIK